MPTFVKVRRNQVIIGGVLVFLLVLLALLLFLPRGQTSTSIATSGSAVVSPSPTDPPSPSSSPSVATASAPAATIGATGAVLKAGTAPDDGGAVNWGANGGPPTGGCGPTGLNWHHAGWTSDQCTLVVLGGDTEHSMAWVIEHKTSDASSRRISVLKGTAGAWVTSLYAIGDGGAFAAISAKAKDITADGSAEIVIGFRMVGTNHVLNLDAVRRTGTAEPVVIVHRELVNGSATLGSGNGFVDYSATGGVYARTQVTYGSDAFRGTTSSVPSAPPSDFS